MHGAFFHHQKGERGTGWALPRSLHAQGATTRTSRSDSTPGRHHRAHDFPGVVERADGAIHLPPVQVIRKNLRILVVDDDPVLSRSLQEYWKSDGHRVTLTWVVRRASMPSAGAAAKATAFDLVITDLGMPRVDGRKVAASIKAASAHTPVILLTGWVSAAGEGRDPPNIDRVLSKTPRVQLLRTAIAELVPERAPAGLSPA